MHLKQTPFPEFVTLVALMSALVALAIDAILPALAVIGADLQVKDPNDAQLVVAVLFIGMAVGPLIFGPLSDTIGRRNSIFLGMSLFIVASVVGLFAQSFEVMLIARLFQGIGASGPRIVSMAMVRDRFEGEEMARVLSFVTAIFIVVPAIAPSIGQAVILLSHWRGIFVLFIVLSLITTLWFGFRQKETLAIENRQPYQVNKLWQSAKSVLSNRIVLAYTVAIGFVFGGFLGYLSSAQQIFQDVYGTGDKFPLYFAGLAIGFGVASLINAKVVKRFGMWPLALSGAILLIGVSIAFLVLCYVFAGIPPFLFFMLYALLVFMCVAIVFGNLNAMAMQPLGKIAGLGASVISALSTLISLPLGILVGQNFNGTLWPLTLGFLAFGCAALIAMLWAHGKKEG
jgi:MFS transporter, DHA1 family, multidrug resistance protein